MARLLDDGFLLEKLMSGTPDAIYFKDLQCRFIMVNQACSAKYGWSTPEEGVGKSDFDIFAPDHARQAFEAEQRIIATGEPLFSAEEKETWPDGRVTWCSTTKMPLRDKAGTIIGIFGISRDATARKEANLRAERYAEQIRAIKEEMEEDARMAGELQKSFSLGSYPVFPGHAEEKDSCVEFLHYFQSSRQVSGDYCSIKRISESKAGVFLCDVAGTGARAALGSALIRGIIQEIVVLEDDPSAYLERMNELLFPLLHPDHLLLDVSACYLVLDVETGLARLASAGHPQPLHFRPGRSVKWLYENLVLRGPGLAVSPAAKYHAVECRLEPEDSVVLFTDGLFNVENLQGEPFCEKRLLQTAKELAGKSLADVFQGLEDAVIGFSSERRYTDDVCLVGFHLRRLLEVRA